MAADASRDAPQDSSNAQPQSYAPDPGKPPGSSRPLYPESNAPWRQQTRPTFQTMPGHSYSQASSSDTQQGPSSIGSRYTAFQARGAHYAQHTGYGGSYTLSPQPADHLRAPPNATFSYAPGFPHHGHMPPLMHHHSSPGPSSMFVHAQVAPSPPPRSPLPSPGSQGGPRSALFYPSHLSTSSFPYQAQPYSPSTPIYQSQYPPASYPSQFIAPGEQESQGTWWYVPSNVPSPNQYDPMSHAFPPHYALPYPSLNRQEFESYSRPGAPPISPVGYPMSPPLPHGHMAHPQVFGVGHESAPPPLAYPKSPGPASSEVSAASARGNPSSVRRPYHPNPPGHRSEWVMWVGNVPGDVTVEELWRVFNHPGPITQRSPGSTPKEDEGPEGQLYGGVVSIYPIVRSNCAFVNFESEAHLRSAIARFNGQPLRANDPKCPRLVCRVRAQEDDLRAGVGAQRGTGLHTRWVREKAEGEEAAVGESALDRVPTPTSSAGSLGGDLARRIAPLSFSSDDEGRFRRGTKKSSSGSYASTNSSFLAHHFPKRYFILKSLTQFDLDLSVEKGLWATQRHNEAILDQAYRTSREVYLIFGVNKSGEFYGYARMASPILRGERGISWASRADSSPASQRDSRRSDTIPEVEGSPTQARQTFLPPGELRLVDESPLPLEPPQKQSLSEEPSREFLSAPAEMSQPHSRFSSQTLPAKPSLDMPLARAVAPTEKFELKEGPVIAARARGAEGVKRLDMLMDAPPSSVAEEEGNWGEPFRVEWVRTARLPFWRTRHLRNQWNHEREVKVSRDGTELEPTVGQALLDEWDRPEPPQSPKARQPKAVGAVPTRRGGG
ncbi:hypothetical protein NEOLEDRAFT_1141276 [Neolentinus lepideus HHB14362 ss-1]|uniref:YTH domain-containing protein n=1 Tax=Neolentinus lepideus HHB14362 ss-1 TaxID=1314782 RepID=A0A165NQT2_9AGAM|nr:hypothetical protein NEOLEDRAFT_1141276 [Neolentinus lepideus HHB14362 ss-1]